MTAKRPARTPTRRTRLARSTTTLFAVVVVALVAAAVFDWGHLDERLRSAAGSGSSDGQPLDTAAFAPGACTAYPPTSGDRGKTVFLDAGHGGIDPGGVGENESGQPVDEADVTLPVELDAMAVLRADGYRVVVSRTGPTTVVRLGPQDVTGGLLTLQGAHDDVVARDVCANDARADVLVGIYFDAGGSAGNAGSLTAYDDARPFTAAEIRLATLLQDDVLADMNAQGWDIPNDGVVPDTSLGSFDGNAADGGIAAEAAAYDHLLLIGPAQVRYFSTPSLMPGAVIEPLYVTDPFEGSIAASTKGQQAMAQGIAQAVEQFLSPPKAPATTTTGPGAG